MSYSIVIYTKREVIFIFFSCIIAEKGSHFESPKMHCTHADRKFQPKWICTRTSQLATCDRHKSCFGFFITIRFLETLFFFNFVLFSTWWTVNFNSSKVSKLWDDLCHAIILKLSRFHSIHVIIQWAAIDTENLFSIILFYVFFLNFPGVCPYPFWSSEGHHW